MEKARQFDFTPTVAGDLANSTVHPLTTVHPRYDENYYGSINSATAIFFLGFLAASVALANILVSASSCKVQGSP